MNEMKKKHIEAENKLRGLGLRIMIQGKNLVVSDDYNCFFNLEHMSQAICRSIPNAKIIQKHLRRGSFHMNYNKRGLFPFEQREIKEIIFTF